MKRSLKHLESTLSGRMAAANFAGVPSKTLAKVVDSLLSESADVTIEAWDCVEHPLFNVTISFYPVEENSEQVP